VYHLAENTGDRVVCPLCKTPIAGWKKKEMTESVEDPDTTTQESTGYRKTLKNLLYWFVVAVIVVGATFLILKGVNVI